MSDAVAFHRVGFSYPEAGSPVLRDVSLALPEAAFALVAGATGAGKSTLLRAMNGLVPHFTGGVFEGRVIVAGRDTLEHAPRQLADVVGFVPQDPRAAFVLDRVEDELAYALENLGVKPSAMRRRVEETLDLLRIEHLRDRSVRQLSGGERQRVAIAAALTARPRVLLLDEPTSQLDPQGAEDVLAALQRLVHDLGLTVVIAEHRLERVAGFVDQAVGCEGDGRVEMGAPGEILDGLDLGPPVTRLGRMLGWKPSPLTVRDARGRASATGPPPRPSAIQPPGRTGPAGPPLLTAQELSARYGRRSALTNVTMSLAPGEVVALAGRNGAGKTTLLRCLAGVHPLAGGVVLVLGRPPRPGHDVALCPQSPEDVLYRDSVLAEVEATARALRRDVDLAALLAELGLTDLVQRHPRDLSAGERLLVATAAVTASRAPILLLDEPTRGVDVPCKERLVAFLRSHASRGHAAVVATHDVELAAEVATRVIMLAAGEVIADGPPEEVLADSPVFAPQMARVFGPPWLTAREVARAFGATQSA